MTYKLLVLYPRSEDSEHFREHYPSVHVPLTLDIPGVKAMRYGVDPTSPTGEPPYFWVTEVEWESREAMEAALQTPEAKAAIADVPTFAPGGPVLLRYEVIEAERGVVADGEGLRAQ